MSTISPSNTSVRPSYSTRYTFSGKERDEETGYSYFGARYYNSDLSIWLSVDPLADKYPSTSPYTYCANNPVRLVDADGRDIWELDECGNIINHIEDDMVDQFRIVDDKGKKAISIHETKGIQNIIKIHTISH